MPLAHGKSKAAFSHNVAAEMHAGKPQKQAVAIAYSQKRKAGGVDGGSAGVARSATSAGMHHEVEPLIGGAAVLAAHGHTKGLC